MPIKSRKSTHDNYSSKRRIAFVMIRLGLRTILRMSASFAVSRIRAPCNRHNYRILKANNTSLANRKRHRNNGIYKLTCSMFLSVVGVNVDVVLVGTPLWIPSNETSCNDTNIHKAFD